MSSSMSRVAPPSSCQLPGSRRKTPPWREASSSRWVIVALGAQLALLASLSYFQFSRFDLTFDFAVYNQATWLIRLGSMNPFSSIVGVPFIKNYGQLLVWPLAIIRLINPSSLVLLLVQDFLLVSANFLVCKWTTLIISDSESIEPKRSHRLQILTLIMVLGDPWCYETALWDVHIEVAVALLALCIAMSLWRGQVSRLKYLLPLLLLCGLTGFLASLALGLSASVVRNTRRSGILLATLGLTGIVGMSLLGMLHGGLSNRQLYGYLGSGSLSGGDWSVVRAMLARPDKVAQVLALSSVTAVTFLLPLGVVGLFSRWAMPISAVMVAPVAVAASPLFHFQVTMAFQVWPAVPFVLVGTVQFLIKINSKPHSELRRGGSKNVGDLAEMLLVIPLLLLILTDLTVGEVIPDRFLSVPAVAAAKLASVSRLIRTQDEVLVSSAVAGRFAQRRYVYIIQSPAASLPLQTPTVFLVFTPTYNASIAPSLVQAFIDALERRDHAAQIEQGDGVYVLKLERGSCRETLSFPSGRIICPRPHELDGGIGRIDE